MEPQKNPLGLPAPWSDFLAPYLPSQEALALACRLREANYQAQLQKASVFPPPGARFAALALTPPQKVRVIILGQDPYHGLGQAMGLCFSVPPNRPCPPSLQNIFTELQQDLGVPRPSSGDLTPWAKQGVLLLNTLFSVVQGSPLSHQHLGWQALSQAILQALSQRPLVALLWGGQAQGFAKDLEGPKHIILRTTHPSPLSAYRGFLGAKPFSKANQALEKLGLAKIDWSLP